MVEQQQHHTAMSSLDTQALLTHHSHYCPQARLARMSTSALVSGESQCRAVISTPSTSCRMAMRRRCSAESALNSSASVA